MTKKLPFTKGHFIPLRKVFLGISSFVAVFFFFFTLLAKVTVFQSYVQRLILSLMQAKFLGHCLELD
jgi:hypothetical protein